MLINFDDKYRDRLFVALMRAQGDVIVQIEEASSGQRDKLQEEYKDLEELAKIIQRTFEG